MTAKEIINRAIGLLGYSTINGNTQIIPRIMNRAISIVNVVYEDLWGVENSHSGAHTSSASLCSAPSPQREGLTEFEPITTLADEIDLHGKALECMTYGVAAFIAQSESDGDQQQVWMSVYNKKRKGLSHTYGRVDVLPWVET